jgi:hypothetical protein
MLYLASCSSRKCNNMTPLGNQACILLKSSLLSSCIHIISMSSWKSILVCKQGTVQQSESTSFSASIWWLIICTLKGPIF